MTNHPNRGKNPNTPGRTPRPHEVKEARIARGLTQQAAARLVHCSLNSWQKWEAGERRCHPAMWELFLRKTKALPVAPETAVEAVDGEPAVEPGDDQT
jgi:DNA-binding transcriptional regulator YiaG